MICLVGFKNDIINNRNILSKGPSIKDVSSEGEGGGYKKWHFGGDFQGLIGETRGGRVLKN